MVTTSDVGDAFWRGMKARGSSVHSTGDELYSYNTLILQRLPDGRTIGNITKYSVTTSKHQSQVGVRGATMFAAHVPFGCHDLRPHIETTSSKINKIMLS
jgi:hypothetical protein